MFPVRTVLAAGSDVSRSELRWATQKSGHDINLFQEAGRIDPAGPGSIWQIRAMDYDNVFYRVFAGPLKRFSIYGNNEVETLTLKGEDGSDCSTGFDEFFIV